MLTNAAAPAIIAQAVDPPAMLRNTAAAEFPITFAAFPDFHRVDKCILGLCLLRPGAGRHSAAAAGKLWNFPEQS